MKVYSIAVVATAFSTGAAAGFVLPNPVPRVRRSMGGTNNNNNDDDDDSGVEVGETPWRGLASAARDARGLCMDMIATAKHGSVGTPLGCAELGAVLYGTQMTYHVKDPQWMNRDRFILSASHGYTFLFAWLHIAGFDLPLEELKKYRQPESMTFCQPIFSPNSTRNIPGIDGSTAPMGQGVASAVGCAVAAKMAAARYNTVEHTIFDQTIFVLAGDGCIQEGVSFEAACFAAHEKLDNLVLLYDCNGSTLDQMSEFTQSENVVKRFEAIGWETFEIDGNDLGSIVTAMSEAKKNNVNKPKFIKCNTLTGKGVKEIEGTYAAHGLAGVPYLGNAKVNIGLPAKAGNVFSEKKMTKKNLVGWNRMDLLDLPVGMLYVNEFSTGNLVPVSVPVEADSFSVSNETRSFFEDVQTRNQVVYDDWQTVYTVWKEKNPDMAAELDAALKDDIMSADEMIQQIKTTNTTGPESTCKSGGQIIQEIAKLIPNYVTGSADLAGVCRNYINDGGRFGFGFDKSYSGRNIYYGIREYAMGCILNGIGYHGIFKASGSTYFAFVDYMRPAVRTASISKLGRISYILVYGFTGEGENEPSLQTVETTSGLRVIPNLDVYRPGNKEETVAAMVSSVTRKSGPTALILTRQRLDENTNMGLMAQREGAFKGGYIAKAEEGKLGLIIIATGAELQHALALGKTIPFARVVSMPCLEKFERQPIEYRELILPSSCTNRIAMEAGVSRIWYEYASKVVGVDAFTIAGEVAMPEWTFDSLSSAIDGMT